MRTWLSNPLYTLAAIILIQFALNPSLPFLFGVSFLIGMSYVQNVSYGIQARAGTRSSNAFHLITAIIAGLVFFITFRYLIQGNMPLALLPAYMFGTIFGNLNAVILSTWIESKIGAKTEAPKNQPQLIRFWPSIIVLLVVLVLQVSFLRFSISGWVVLSIAALTLLDSFSFAVLRLARSSDNYWFHGVTAFAHISVAFLKLAIMIKYQMDWVLFWPITTGSVIGSLAGQYCAREVTDWLKAGFDNHVSKVNNIAWPRAQVLVSLSLMSVHLFILGFNNLFGAILLFVYAFGQSTSFAVVSRARQRNHQGYLLWSSVFSNGIWYMTMHQLAINNITADKAGPYVVGNTTGSLVGQNVAMNVEKKVNARMDSDV